MDKFMRSQMVMLEREHDPMNTSTHPDEATPLTHDLGDPLIHEEREPVARRMPRPEDIVLSMHLEWGIPLRECKMMLCAMNFEQVEL